MTESSAAAASVQLLAALRQLDARGADGSGGGSDGSATAAAIDALLQVQSFVSLAAAAAAGAAVTLDGSLELPSGHTTDSTSTSGTSTSTLLAAVLAKLAVSRLRGVDTILLQQLLPQLLSCPAQLPDGAPPAWAASLCSAAAELAATGHAGAPPLAVSAVSQLEELLSPPSSAGGALQLGAAACVQLLELLLTSRSGEQCQLQPALQQRLLACVIPRLTTAGEAVGAQLQGHLIAPLMTAAAAAAAGDAPSSALHSCYVAACEQLLHVICGSSQAPQALSLACRLQPHALAACSASAECRQLLHELLLQGLLHGHPQCRRRAVHLLEASAAAGCGPQGLSPAELAGFALLHQVMEQHVLHLVQPVWEQHFAQLWRAVARAAGGQQLDAGLLVRWCSVLVLRGAVHPNVSVKRLALAGFLQLGPTTLQQLVSGGGWPALQSLLLQLLPALEDRKLVMLTGAGSATARQLQAVQQLQQQLSGFLATSQQLLLAAKPEGAAAVQQLQRTYVEQAVAASERAPTLLLALQALADAAVAVGVPQDAGSSSSSSSSGPVLEALTRALGAVPFMHPDYLQPPLRRTLLQLVAACCRPQDCTPAAAVQLLAGGGCGLVVVPAAAVQAGPERQQQQQRSVFAAPGFLPWLDDALMHGDAHAEPTKPSLLQWLQTALASASAASSVGGEAQLHAAMHTLGLLARELRPAAQQGIAVAVLNAAAARPTTDQGPWHPTAAAWLVCGLVSGRDAASECLEACVAQALPALLRHHQASSGSSGSCYNGSWCQAIVALADAAAGSPRMRPALCQELQSWLPSLEHHLSAATGAGITLDRQLLLLSSGLVACAALEPPAASGEESGSGSGLPLGALLQQLLQLTPAQQLSAGASSSSSSSSSRMELTDRLLIQHALLMQQLVAAAGGQLPRTIKQQLFTRCCEDLEWSGDGSLRSLLSVLQAVAPFDALTAPDSHQQQQQGSSAADELQELLHVLPQLVRERGKRLSADEAAQLVQVFFSRPLFSNSQLRSLLDTQLLPFALAQGGQQLSVTVMSHLCWSVLGPNPGLAHSYLPHLAHMAAFSLFQERVDQAAALQQQKCDVAVLLPARVVLCAFLVRQTRHGQPAFVSGLVRRLLAIAAADSPAYSWLAAREAGQSSPDNGIKVAVWQSLCLLAPHIPEAQLDEALQQGWACLMCSHQHGNLRPHVQLFLLALLSRRPDAVSTLLLPALSSYATSSYQVTVSVIILGLFTLLELGPRSPLFAPLLCALFPWALHHRHAVRVPVQVMLHLTFSRHMSAIEDSTGSEATQLLTQVRRFLDTNEETKKLRERQALVDLQGFSLAHETSLAGMFGVREDQLEQLCDGESDATGLLWPLHVRERLPLDLLSCLPGAVKAVGARRPAVSSGAAGTGSSGHDGADPDAGGDDNEAVAGADGVPSMHQFRPQLQDELFNDAAADRVGALAEARASRPGLVLCASLLTNVPNLAGLCRTCESLSAEALVVASRAVVATDAFKKQSRTSERHLRLLEVGQADVPRFLAERRAAGYAIIGVEQATNSVALQDYTFPARCVLVLGNEQQGMPTSLLDCLDVCLEIPLLGHVQSLNAHVAGAMVLWQYTQQQLKGAQQQHTQQP